MISIHHNGAIRRVTAVYVTDADRKIRRISSIHDSNGTLWLALRCCFSSGMWVENMQWLDNEPWKD